MASLSNRKMNRSLSSSILSVKHEKSNKGSSNSQRTSSKDDDKNSLITQLQQQEKSLKLKLKNYKELKDKVAHLSKEKENLNKETSFLCVNLNQIKDVQYPYISKLTQDNTELQLSFNHLNTDFDHLMKTKEDALNKINVRNEEIAFIAKAIEEISSKLSQEDIEINTLLESKQSLSNELSSSSKRQKELIKENTKYSIECTVKNKLIKDSERLKEKLNKECKDTHKEIKEMMIDIKNNTEAYWLFKGKLGSIEDQISELRQKADFLKEQKANEVNVIMKTQRSKEMNEGKELELGKQIEVVKCQLEHEKDYYTILRNDIKAYEAKNVAMRELIETLEEKNEVIRREIYSVTSQSGRGFTSSERITKTNDREYYYKNNKGLCSLIETSSSRDYLLK